MTHTDIPAFALVGHPNKGKSSIISTLAYDDSVKISATPGETTQTKVFPLKVDGKVQYRLFDTPGFQVPRKVLAWLKAHETTSSRHPEVIREFLDTHRNDPAFRDEVELLTPISKGACIVYVVDGSKPYSEEYESEMEILRWSGQPSIALINTIDDEDHTIEWEKALNQHFKMVRLFNPMQVTFSDKTALLDALSQLNSRWTESLKASMDILKLYQEQRINESAILISENIYHSMTYTLTSSVFKTKISKEDTHRYAEKYLNHLLNLEQQNQKEIERLWGHAHLVTYNTTQEFHTMELFSEQSRKAFGLSKSSLVMASAAAGAVAGGGAGIIFAPIDGGISTLITASFGALTGVFGSLAGYGKYLNIITLGGRFEKKQLQIGPMKDENFPFILLARSIHHATQIAKRSHAVRTKVDLGEHFADALLDNAQKKELSKIHQQIRKGVKLDQTKKSYTEIIRTQLCKNIL